MSSWWEDKKFRQFLTKFLLLFGLFYLGSLAVIGLSAKGGYYVSFVDHYLNYIDWMRMALIRGAKWLLSLCNFETYILGYRLRMVNGRGIILAYSCVGYGVMSFWAAFVIASAGTVLRKICWIAGGFLLIYFINIIRIALLVVAINRNWPMPLGIDHHTWFNIVAYGFIFTLMYFFEKRNRGQELPKTHTQHG